MLAVGRVALLLPQRRQQGRFPRPECAGDRGECATVIVPRPSESR